MADAAVRRRCRDEQRAMTYREAVRLGMRRPWTPRQARAARRALSELDMFDLGVSSAPMAAAYSILRSEGSILRWLKRLNFGNHEIRQRAYGRLRSWAERVLRETAELEGEA